LKEEVFETKHLVNIESDSNEEKAIFKTQINSCPKDTPLNEEIEQFFVENVVNSMENNSFVTKSNDNTSDIPLNSEDNEQILNENVFDIKSDNKEYKQLFKKEKK
jgi:hypothetical protein